MRTWARSELVRRWRALVVLGVIAGLAAGLAMAATAGARRTSTAYSRWRTATNAPDAILFGTQVIQDPEAMVGIDYSNVVKLPEVVDAGRFTLAPVAAPDPGMGGLQPGDDHLYRTLARPLLRSGRLPDAARDDEIVVNLPAAHAHHLHVGQKIRVVGSTDINDWLSAPMNTYPSGVKARGPDIQATIVGIGNSMIDLIFQPREPGFTVGWGFMNQHREVPRAPNLVVRLKPGTDGNAFRAAAAKAMGLPDIPIRDLRDDQKRITHGTDLERTALWLFAGAVVLAGLVLVGQALTRTVYTMAESTPALRALGFTRPNIVGGVVLPTVVTAVVAAAVAVSTAVLLSSRFPVGLARSLDPGVGTHADLAVLLPGAAILVALVLAGASYAGWRAAIAGDGPAPAPSSSRAMAGIRNRLPLPAAIGAGLALQGGRGDRALPVRPAIAGAVAGVLGIVGALGLVRGIDDALAVPSRSGQVWDAIAHPDDDPAHSIEAMSAKVKADRQVARAAFVARGNVDVNGAGLPIYKVEPVKGDFSFVVLDGRAPRAPDEVAVGPSSLQALHRSVGGRLNVTASSGAPSSLKVVGTALLWQTAHSSFDQGIWVTPAAYDALIPPDSGEQEPVVMATARSGIKPAAFVQHITKELGVEPEATDLPQDVVLLRNVRNLPRALAAFLVLLGVAAVGHALIMTVRRRRHDLAVLRAIGLRPRQSAACIFWQALTVAVVALAIGIPLGVVAGRLSWRWVADSTPLLYVGPVAVVAIVIAIPASLALANMLAAYPATRAAGVRPAEVLRTE